MDDKKLKAIMDGIYTAIEIELIPYEHLELDEEENND